MMKKLCLITAFLFLVLPTQGMLRSASKLSQLKMSQFLCIQQKKYKYTPKTLSFEEDRLKNAAQFHKCLRDLRIADGVKYYKRTEINSIDVLNHFIETNNTEMIAWLVPHIKNINKRGRNSLMPLGQAVIKRNVSAVNILLERGDLAYKNEALEVAMDLTLYEIAELLLRAGAKL